MFKIATLLMALFALIHCSSNPSLQSSRTPSSAKISEADFETDKDDEKFMKMMSELNLEDPNYIFEYKKTSTSAGVKISVKTTDKDGKADIDKLGKWVPENSANNVEAQVVAYSLGRFLGMTDLVGQADYYTMGPKGLARFKPLLNCAKEKGQHKDNCVKILSAINKNPNAMIGSFSNHVKNEIAIDAMIAPGSPNGKLNPKHPIAGFISAAGPMPAADKKMNLGVKYEKDDKTKILAEETQLNLARQFSKIMILDMLTGQWDRFSGGNIETIYKEKKNAVQFIALDNGGASMKGKGQDLYYKTVSRFDRQQIQRVEHLLTLLNEDETNTLALLKMKSSSLSLKNRCIRILDHVAAQVKAYGDSKVFFPEG